MIVPEVPRSYMGPERIQRKGMPYTEQQKRDKSYYERMFAEEKKQMDAVQAAALGGASSQ